MSSFSEMADAEITASIMRSSVCVINKTARYREQTAPYAFESLSRMSNTDQHRVVSSRTHLVLQDYWLTGIDEINPLGIETIRSVPKKYRTRYPALVICNM